MANFLQEGLEYLYTIVSQESDVELLIGITGQPRQSIMGTITNSYPLLDPAKLKTQAQRYYILVDTAALLALELPLQRGIEIEYGENLYEMVIDPKGCMFPNDPMNLRTVLVCTKKVC